MGRRLISLTADLIDGYSSEATTMVVERSELPTIVLAAPRADSDLPMLDPDDLLDVASDVSDLLWQAMKLEAAGDLDGAVESLEAAIESTMNPVCLNHLGSIWARRGDLERAANFVRLALSYDPKHPVYEANLSRIRRLSHRSRGLPTQSLRSPRRPSSLTPVGS